MIPLGCKAKDDFLHFFPADYGNFDPVGHAAQSELRMCQYFKV